MSNSPTETADEALQRGMQYARNYDWAAATEAFRKAVALDPDSTEPRFRLGWSLWNQAEIDKPTLADMAVVYGAQVLGFDQTARDGKRRFQYYRQLLGDSVFYLRSVIERDANHARAYHYLAKVLQALDQRAEADEAAHMAAKLDPQNTSYTNLAQSFEQAAPAPTSRPIDESRMTWDDLVMNPKT